MVYPLTSRFIFPVLRLFIASLEGQANLETLKPPFIVAANHVSQADPLLIIAALFPYYRSKIHFLANRGNYGSIFERLIASRWAGCILLDPNNKAASLDLAWQRLQQNEIVGVFPEGERQPNSSDLLRGKTGLVRLALKARLPILPIGVMARGERHRFRNNELHSLGWDAVGHYLIKGERSKLVIDKPIKLENYYDQPVSYGLLRQATDEVMREIAKLSGKEYPY